MPKFVHPPEPEIFSHEEAGARKLALRNASKEKENSELESDSETDESDSDSPAQPGVQISSNGGRSNQGVRIETAPSSIEHGDRGPWRI